jgi:hypothetical protein
MLNRKFLLGTLLAVLVSSQVAFSNPKPEGKDLYEYVDILQTEVDLIVTEQGKAPTQELLKKEKRNLNTAFEHINKYEAQGYELFESETASYSGGVMHAYLLRRKKP